MADSSFPRQVPEAVLRALAARFDAAATGHADVAAHLLLGLSGIIAAAETYLPGRQADVAGGLAAAILRAVPAMEEHSAADAPMIAACAHGAMALAMMLGRSFDEARALVVSGQADLFLDAVGLGRAGIEVVWRSKRLASRMPTKEPDAVAALSALVVGAMH